MGYKWIGKLINKRQEYMKIKVNYSINWKYLLYNQGTIFQFSPFLTEHLEIESLHSILMCSEVAGESQGSTNEEPKV